MMKSLRIAALFALPATFSLAACGGGSSSAGFANVTGSTASVRFINANPTGGSVDVYVQSTGSNPPSAKVAGPLSYGEATDYMTEPAVAGTLEVQTAGGAAPSTGATPLAACPFPAMSSANAYTLVYAHANGISNCLLFQDVAYTSAPQIRFHDASYNASQIAADNPLAFGTISTPAAPAGTSFTVLGTGPFGTVAVGNGSPATYTAATPTTIAQTGTSITFAIGPNNTAGATDSAIDTLDSRYIFGPNALNQPDTTGALNYPGSAGTSLFAFDCTAASVASLPNVQCNSGIALVGYTDSK